MTAVHDTLRQTIAAALKPVCPYSNTPAADTWTDLVAQAVLAAVLADPTIRRWKTIADEVDGCVVTDSGQLVTADHTWFNTTDSAALFVVWLRSLPGAAGKTT